VCFGGHVEFLIRALSGSGTEIKFGNSRKEPIAQGELEALPMMQRVKVRASFHRCKQNFLQIDGQALGFT